MKLTNDIREGINQKQVTLLLLFDFSKALDSVCHATLLRRLRERDLAKSAIKWVISYLNGRKQAVCCIEYNAGWVEKGAAFSELVPHP